MTAAVAASRRRGRPRRRAGHARRPTSWSRPRSGGRASHLDTAGRVVGIGTLVLPYRPVVDGDVIPTAPIDSYRAGVTDDQPILLGATSQEFDRRPARRGDGRRPAGPTVGSPRPGPTRRPGPTSGPRPPPTGSATARPLPTRGSECRPCASAEARFEAEAPTFVYDFDWRSATWGGFGAGALPRRALRLGPAGRRGRRAAWPATDPPQALADRMHRAWVGFVTHGDAGWPAYRLSATGGPPCASAPPARWWTTCCTSPPALALRASAGSADGGGASGGGGQDVVDRARPRSTPLPRPRPPA